MEHIYDALVLGGGPCGYTAALYAARAGMDTLVLEKLSAGGQMALTGQVENYPGFDEGIDGFALGERMQRGAERFGAKTELTEILAAELAGPVKTVKTSGGVFCGRTAILAMGAVPRRLGLAGEEMLTGRGIHYCAACDGMAYRGKTVAVVGGGNTAAAEALLLSHICRRVILVHRRDTLRAERIYHESLQKASNLEFCWNRVVTGLQYGERLTGLWLRQVQTGETLLLPCDGAFVCIGRTPATALFRGQLDSDEAGYLVADESTRTRLPGVFAAGDMRAKALRQIVTAAADGAVAAHFAQAYLTGG